MQRQSGPESLLFVIAHGNGRFVATDSSGTVLTATDWCGLGAASVSTKRPSRCRLRKWSVCERGRIGQHIDLKQLHELDPAAVRYIKHVDGHHLLFLSRLRVDRRWQRSTAVYLASDPVARISCAAVSR